MPATRYWRSSSAVRAVGRVKADVATSWPAPRRDSRGSNGQYALYLMSLACEAGYVDGCAERDHRRIVMRAVGSWTSDSIDVACTEDLERLAEYCGQGSFGPAGMPVRHFGTQRCGGASGNLDRALDMYLGGCRLGRRRNCRGDRVGSGMLLARGASDSPRQSNSGGIQASIRLRERQCDLVPPSCQSIDESK